MGRGEGLWRHRMALAVLAVLIVGVVTVALDWRQAKHVLSNADWRYLPPALLFTAISYAALSLNFAVVNRMFHRGFGRYHILLVGFVSVAINHMVSLAGIAAITLRLAFMRGHGIKSNDIVATSLVTMYISSLVLNSMMPIGLVFFLSNSNVSTGAAVVAVAATILVIALLGAATILLLNRGARQRFSRVAAWIAGRVARRDIHAALEEFDETLARGVATFRAHPREFAAAVAWVPVDWLACVAALGFCFKALGTDMAFGVLLSGFVVGVIAGVLSLIPGGLGVQEGSMAGVFAILGVPFNEALLGSLLYRVVYYVIPFGISLLFYWPLLRRARAAERAAQQPSAPV